MLRNVACSVLRCSGYCFVTVEYVQTRGWGSLCTHTIVCCVCVCTQLYVEGKMQQVECWICRTRERVERLQDGTRY